ncbi:hypothetical protein K438DRAFT_1962845 [Mycena galopus ATCC 62051]|nr:hypothetical protein K438DRAFT_1962845 [Mycena galopus ATCC 62051]
MSSNPNLLGGIEIGTLVAVVLLGMVTVQIALIWLTEAAHVGAICYGLYRMTVTRYGQLELPIPLELCVAAVLGNVIHPVVQSIFTARIFQLGKSVQSRILTGVCWGISGFTFGATILLSIKVFAATSLDQFEEEWDWLILGLFGATGGVDLLIAAAMLFYTMKNRGVLKPEGGTLDMIISWTAQTGLFTCMAAIAVAVCFATMKRDHIWLPLLILTTGLYSNSLLSLLNGRLQLGYQTESPFMISMSTFHHSANTGSRSGGQVQFSYPPTVHLQPPPEPKGMRKSQPSNWSGSTRAISHAGSTLGLPMPHYTLARENVSRFSLDAA